MLYNYYFVILAFSTVFSISVNHMSWLIMTSHGVRIHDVIGFVMYRSKHELCIFSEALKLPSYPYESPKKATDTELTLFVM